ncbi:MAG TPA: DUF4349 domain-containing protein [Armatimonadota bacterium]|nr:DUF4349 domain-containing protein [Armatimonadota bacterium]
METSRKKPNYWKAAFLLLIGAIFLIFLLFPVFFRARRSASSGSFGGSASRQDAAVNYKSMEPANEAQPTSWGTAQASSLQRMVISTAEMSLEVGDVAKAHDEIGRLANASGGFITESSVNHGDGTESGSVTIRVPAKQYQPLLSQISKLGKVLQKQQSGQDVTEEFVDLQSRLRNLNREEQAFLVVMGKANKVTDILAVENELSRVRGQIEQATGRMKYLQNQVALATITVQLTEPMPAVTKIVNWDVFMTAKGAANALQVVFRKILSIVIWAVVFIPFWALVGLVIYGGKRYARRAK